MDDIFRNMIRTLDEKHIIYTVSEHPPVGKSEEAARVRGVPLQSGVKALLVKTREEKFLMVLVRGDKKADFKTVAELEGTKKVSFATPQEVLERTGCEIGSVPPFGYEPLKTYMDKTILENDIVNFNAGLHTRSLAMKPKDLVEVVKPILF